MKSARKSQVTDFIQLTGCSEKQATKLLENAKWNMQQAINIFYDQGILPEPEQVDKIMEIEDLAAKWAGKDEKNKENIGEDGLQNFFQLLNLDLANPVVGYIMINGMGMEKAGEATKTNMYNLFKYTHSHSITEVASKIHQVQKEMDERKDLYKRTYQKLFDFYSVTKIATLDFDIAEQLWDIYLKRVMVLHSEFMEYLKVMENKPVKVHRDLWKMVYQFAISCPSIEKYSQDDGWPVFIDEFIQFLKNK